MKLIVSKLYLFSALPFFIVGFLLTCGKEKNATNDDAEEMEEYLEEEVDDLESDTISIDSLIDDDSIELDQSEDQ